MFRHGGSSKLSSPSRARQAPPMAQRSTPALLPGFDRGFGGGPSWVLVGGGADWFPVSSSRETPKHWLKAMSLSSSGVESPPSHFDTACLETPSFSASCSWERPFLRLSV